MARIVGTSGKDKLNGTADRDTILGKAGDDELRGLEGDDLLDGGANDDVLRGGAGNDVLVVGGFGEQFDYAYGGAGNDTLDARDADGEVDFELGEAGQVEGYIDAPGDSERGDDIVIGFDIENLSGGAFDDDLAGNDSGNVLNGRSGDDYLRGEGGNDTLIGGTGDDFYDDWDNEGSDNFIVQKNGSDFDTIALFDCVDEEDTLTLTGFTADEVGELETFSDGFNLFIADEGDDPNPDTSSDYIVELWGVTSIDDIADCIVFA